MERKIYISNDELTIAEYCNDFDAEANYNCWQDHDTQKGYNYKMAITLEAFKNRPIRSRFQSVIIRKSDNAVIGTISMSPENSLPDLAIMIYPPYRKQGYGTKAFTLALQYCFNKFNLDRIYAGCYETNAASLKMLTVCGFIPHPEGNEVEKHFETGAPITQLDFVKYRVDTK
ncbi:MAG: GNAT family N-acetyltransferase [Clostridia bacterium]|nr:GNAT family N-acetyltransferase [Clostridia bacterium]